MAKQTPSTSTGRAAARGPRTVRADAGPTPRAPRAGSSQDVADRLHSAAIHLLRRLRRVDAAMGITAARSSALSVLVFGGAKTIGELATLEQVSAPTMTKMVSGMEEEGLVKREADAQDGRIVRVRATPRGAKILHRGREARVRELASALDKMRPAEVATLGRAADILRAMEKG